MKKTKEKNNKVNAGLKLKNAFIKAWNKEVWKKILTGTIAFATVMTLSSGCETKKPNQTKPQEKPLESAQMTNATISSEAFETLAETSAQSSYMETVETTQTSHSQAVETTESSSGEIKEERPIVENPWQRESLLLEDRLQRGDYSFDLQPLTVPEGAKSGYSSEEERQENLKNKNIIYEDLLSYYEYMWATRQPELTIPVVIESESQLSFVKSAVSSFEYRHLGVNYYPEYASKFTLYRYNSLIENEDGSYSVVLRLFDDRLFTDEVTSQTVFDEYDLAKEKAKEMVAEVSKTVSCDASEEEMAKALLDALAQNTEYYNIDRPVEGYTYNDYATAYTGIVNGMALCTGYTASYALLLKLAGIDTVAVEADNHIWNMVFVDGNVLWTDATFYDQETRKASEYAFQVPEEGGFANSESHIQSKLVQGYNTVTYQIYLQRIAQSMEQEKAKLNDETLIK